MCHPKIRHPGFGLVFLLALAAATTPAGCGPAALFGTDLNEDAFDSVLIRPEGGNVVQLVLAELPPGALDNIGPTGSSDGPPTRWSVARFDLESLTRLELRRDVPEDDAAVAAFGSVSVDAVESDAWSAVLDASSGGVTATERSTGAETRLSPTLSTLDDVRLLTISGDRLFMATTAFATGQADATTSTIVVLDLRAGTQVGAWTFDDYITADRLAAFEGEWVVLVTRYDETPSLRLERVAGDGQPTTILETPGYPGPAVWRGAAEFVWGVQVVGADSSGAAAEPERSEVWSYRAGEAAPARLAVVTPEAGGEEMISALNRRAALVAGTMIVGAPQNPFDLAGFARVGRRDTLRVIDLATGAATAIFDRTRTGVGGLFSEPPLLGSALSDDFAALWIGDEHALLVYNLATGETRRASPFAD